MRIIQLINKRGVWIFVAIFISGIFLRSYNFHDWLRFNMDQGRDAILVSNVVEGKNSWPLIGPKAGGTEFKLGPMFYYFQISACKIFGNSPESMAYPDLIFSILSIPLFYLFFRRYFETGITLMLTALLSFSFFHIQFSRFAWNPNSTPFWACLTMFGLHNLISKKSRSWLWTTITGIAVGVGVQLHTSLLLILPVTVAVTTGYSFIKKSNIFKHFFLIIFISLILNIPQFIYDIRNDGRNFDAFLTGINTKQSSQPIHKNILRDTACWIDSGVYVLSGYEISESCNFEKTNSFNYGIIALGAIFFIGGIIAYIKLFARENDQDRKNFLIINCIFFALAFIIYIPLAFQISMRFFIMFLIIPLILLGFWFKFFGEKYPWFKYVSISLTAILVISNLYFLNNYYSDFQDWVNGKGAGNVIRIVTLKEIEAISDFIVFSSQNNNISHLKGKEQYLDKAYKPIKYFTDKHDLDLKLVDKDESPCAFYLTTSSSKNKLKMLKNSPVPIEQYKFGRFLIYVDCLENQTKI